MGRRNRREKRREARRSLPLQSLHNSFLAPTVRNIYSRIYEKTYPSSKSNTRFSDSLYSRPLFRDTRAPDSGTSRGRSGRTGGLTLHQLRNVLESQPVLNQRRTKTVCESRRERRELLFAFGYGGRIGQRTPRFTQTSKISCKKVK